MFRMGLKLTAVCAISLVMTSSVPLDTYDIVIYGGGPQAVSAALTAVKASNGKAEVLMIVPERHLGSVMTAGRQNLFDLNYYKSGSLPPGIPEGYEGTQGGSLFRFVRELGAVFPPDEMARYFAKEIKDSGRIRVLYDTDITGLDLEIGEDGAKERSIRALSFQKIRKDSGTKRYEFRGNEQANVRASIFVDASETGRLTRMSGAAYNTGREDTGKDQLQMTATLMYKVKGVDAYAAIAPNKKAYGAAYSKKGSFQLWGGGEVYSIPELMEYDRSNPHFRLKAYNAGEDGYSHVGADTLATPFWMNHLIIYQVDARKAWRDKGQDNGLYPDSEGLDPEEARELALAELKKPEYWEMIRKLPGLSRIEPVLENGEPAVGEILYLRESIHASNRPEDGRAHALTRQDVMNGGESLYNRRIGLGFYNFDSNTYKKQEALTNPLHEPWYVPYDVLRTPDISNLLLPGYAANIDSYSWSAMRVYPNLIMLGDAAGAAAGLAVQEQFRLNNPSEHQMKLLQDTLYAFDAILDK
jgi:hypothetical protein